MGTRLDNANPTVFAVKRHDRPARTTDLDDSVPDPIDAEEVFDLVRAINDPEHPLTLEQLNVVEERLISVDDPGNKVEVSFTPTIPHCSMATLIGLCIKVKLLRSLPPRFKIAVAITHGSHNSETAINKQLADKERVAAAMENQHLIGLVNRCLYGDPESEAI